MNFNLRHTIFLLIHLWCCSIGLYTSVEQHGWSRPRSHILLQNYVEQRTFLSLNTALAAIGRRRIPKYDAFCLNFSRLPLKKYHNQFGWNDTFFWLIWKGWFQGQSAGKLGVWCGAMQSFINSYLFTKSLHSQRNKDHFCLLGNVLF